MLNLAFLIVGVVVVEVIFVYPGMGQYLVDHVTKRDVPVVQAVGLIFAAVYIGLNIIADIARDRRQSAAQASEMRAAACLTSDASRIGALIGLVLTALFLLAAIFAPLIAPYGNRRDRRRRLGADVGGASGWAPTISAATCCRA